MAWTKVQADLVGTATSGLTVAATLGATPTAGNLIVVGLLFYDGSSTPPTFLVDDGAGHTFINLNTSGSSNMSSAGWIGQAYLIVPSGAGKTITCTFNNSIGGAAAIWVEEFHPPSGAVSLDNNPTFSSGLGTINGPTITVTTVDDLLFGTACDGSSVGSATGAWTAISNQFGCDSGYILSASTNTAVGFTGTGGVEWNGLGVSFKYSATDSLMGAMVM